MNKGKPNRFIIAAVAALCMASGIFAGCSGKKNDPYAATSSKTQEKKRPKPEKSDAPKDFFPLKVNFSWKYYLWDCPACPKRTIDVLITGKKVVGGKEIYTLNNGMTGYVENGNDVYLMLIDKEGGLVNLGIAGKHDLKPGDSWDYVSNVMAKVTKKDGAGKAAGINKMPMKMEIESKGETKKSICGEQQMIGLPSDEAARTYFHAICCTVAAKDGTAIKREHVACYAPGVGLVAEYFTDARSEIASFSSFAADPAEEKKAKKELPVKKPSND